MKTLQISRINPAILLVVTLALLSQYCGSSKKITQVKEVDPSEVVSYEVEIAPIMANSCSPCHFPETGKKKLLHTYEATRDNIEDIVYRVELSPDEKAFMPFKSKKEPLTQAEIGLLKDWMAQGMPE